MASVLIVEDERSLRETLARFLTQEGHDVISAANGREAFDQGITAKPDVLVTDWMLKNHIHGLHVAEALKAVHSAVTTERRTNGRLPAIRGSASCAITAVARNPSFPTTAQWW